MNSPVVRALIRKHRLDLFGVLLAITYGLPSLSYPFGADQGIHWYVGHGWLHGHMPYATGISGKPPGIFLVHALAITLFGHGQSAIRWMELWSLPLLGWVVASCTRAPAERLRTGLWGAATLLVSVINYTYADYWNTAHPELWEALCLLAALRVALHHRHNAKRAALSGALCMAAFVLKYPAAAVAIPIAAVCGARAWLETSERPVRAFSIATLSYLLGAAAVMLITFLPFVVTGTVREMLEVCIDMTVRYSGGARTATDWWPGFWKLHRGGTIAIWSLSFAVLGAGVVIRRRQSTALRHGLLLLVVLVAAIASVVLQGRNWSYHWVVVFPFIALLGLWGMSRVVARDGLLIPIVVALALTAFAFAPRFIAHQPKNYRAHVAQWLDLVGGHIDATDVADSFERLTRGEHYASQRRIGLAAREHGRPGDTLCVKGFLSPIYQVSGLRCSSRHAIQAFVGLGPPSWKTQYADDMRNHPPTFIVTFDDRRAELRDLQQYGYRELTREDGLVLLRRSGR